MFCIMVSVLFMLGFFWLCGGVGMMSGIGEWGGGV